MLKNHLTVAWRNLTKYKFYALINIAGLAFGLAAFLFILLYVRHELSYDRYHPQAERTYRIDADGRLGDQTISTGQTGAPVGPTLVSDFPEVETYCRFRNRGSFLVRYEDQHFKQENALYADSTLFQVFGFELIRGNPSGALAEPNTMVVTRDLALRYFGRIDVLGETLVLDNKTTYKVAGVMENPPGYTHFEVEMLLSMATLEDSRNNVWGNMNYNTYLVLKEGVDVGAFAQKMNQHFLGKYFAPEVEKYVGLSWEKFLEAGNAFDFSLFPVTRIHLYSDKDDELAANSDIKYVWIFSLIGLFILFIACINFMNLSTARSAIRAKEIGVRKVVGARRRDLVRQFLGESLLVSGLAMLLAWALVYLAVPYFNELSGKDFSRHEVFGPFFLVVTFLTVGLTGLIAGSYPAVFLSRFQPIKVLKGVFKMDRSKAHFRNALVVFQFLITVFLICSTLVVYRQLNFIQNKKLGFDRDRLIILNDVYALGNRVKAFKERMLSLPQVDKASITGFLPVPSYRNSSSYFKGRQADLANAILINNWYVDHDYIATMDMDLVKGRDFDPLLSTDSSGVIINERLAKYFDGDPIGQELSHFPGDDNTLASYKIIGVVRDFNYESLRQNIEPLALFLGNSTGFITMRVNSDDIPGFVQTLQDNWTEMAAGQPFSFSFMNERFDRIYRNEQRIGHIIGVFAFLAILIACIGLIGLSTFIAQQRTKEIGIRKVLGASTFSLVALISREFFILVFIALLLALPLSWMAMNKWLQSFAYRIDIGWQIFVLAAVLALGIAVLTVGFQGLRAAWANPVKSLRSE